MSAYLGVLLIASVFAIGSIRASWLRYWPHGRQMRQQIAACPATRELRFTIISVEVGRVSAVIHRPVFTPQKLAFPPSASRRAA